MNLHTAHIIWNRGDQFFLDNRYSRRHIIKFDGGISLPGSSSPHVVRVPMSDPSAVDPEEAFVASIASCHMLWFLSIAAARNFCVDEYSVQAEGIMQKNKNGKLAMELVTLRPKVSFSGDRQPTEVEFLSMHHQAHDECFIANSVLTEIEIKPVIECS